MTDPVHLKERERVTNHSHIHRIINVDIWLDPNENVKKSDEVLIL